MFEHSIRVPRLYKTATVILKKVKNNGDSLKSLVYEKKFQNIKAIYALIVTTLKYTKEIDFLLKKTQLLEKEQRLDPFLARILITELLWGKKTLPGESKPIKTILSYQQLLNAHISDVHIEESQIKKVSKPRYVRVNTILTSVNEVVEGFRDEGWTFVRFMDTNDYDGFLSKVSNLEHDEFMVDIHIKELLIFPPGTQFYRHDAYKNGLIILQDKASCLPVYFLDPQPGSNVLDMCAAPGMKTSQIAAMINNEGKIFAVDKDVARLEILSQLMEKSSIKCVSAINKDILHVTDVDCPDVEYILVDPSCSGTGIVDRMDFTQSNSTDEYRVQKLAGFQIIILKHAVRKFPKAKRIVYSTCSLNSAENEAVVKEVISMCPAFKLVPAGEMIKSKWHNFGGEEFGEIGRRCVYTKPENDLTNGFFVAVFERLDKDEQNEFYVDKTLNREIGLNGDSQMGNHDNEGSIGDESHPPECIEDSNLKKDHRKNKNYVDEETYNDEEIHQDKNAKKRKKSKPNQDDQHEATEDAQVSKKKKKSKIEIEDNPSDETNSESHKKKQSKNTNDHEFSSINHQEIHEEEHVPKKKKKSKSEKENISRETNAQEEITEDIPKKKKKSKTEKEHVSGETNVLEEIIEDVPKKRKKSKTEEHNSSETNVQEEITEDVPKKKNKSKTDKGHNYGETKPQDEITDDVPKKKKKSKTDKAHNNSGETNAQDEITEDVPKKKKKSKTKKENNSSETNTEEVVTEHIPKKKKNSKIENETNTPGNSEITNCKSHNEKKRDNHESRVEDTTCVDDSDKKHKKKNKHNKHKNANSIEGESVINDNDEQSKSSKRKRKHAQEINGDDNVEKTSKRKKLE